MHATPRRETPERPFSSVMRVADLDHNCHRWARRVRHCKAICQEGAQFFASPASAPTCLPVEHADVTGTSSDCTDGKDLRIRRVPHVLATSAHRRDDLAVLYAMDCVRACESAALRARDLEPADAFDVV